MKNILQNCILLCNFLVYELKTLIYLINKIKIQYSIYDKNHKKISKIN